MLFNLSSPLNNFINDHVQPVPTNFALEVNDTSETACVERMKGPNMVYSGQNDTNLVGFLTATSTQTSSFDYHLMSGTWCSPKTRPHASQLNEYYMWQGQHMQTMWGSDEANRIYGTDGRSFRPNLPNHELTVFLEEGYRSDPPPLPPSLWLTSSQPLQVQAVRSHFPG